MSASKELGFGVDQSHSARLSPQVDLDLWTGTWHLLGLSKWRLRYISSTPQFIVGLSMSTGGVVLLRRTTNGEVVSSEIRSHYIVPPWQCRWKADFGDDPEVPSREDRRPWSTPHLNICALAASRRSTAENNWCLVALDRGGGDGTCVRRISPGRVETLVGRVGRSLRPRPVWRQPRGQVVLADDDSLFFVDLQRVGYVNAGDPTRKVVTCASLNSVPGAFPSSIALDDKRGILYVTFVPIGGEDTSSVRSRVFALDVPSSASRRREHFMKMALLFRLHARDHRSHCASPASTTTSFLGATWRATLQKMRGKPAAETTLQLIARVSRHHPVVIPLIFRFLSN